LPDLSLIMLGAGDSTRFKHTVKKQWLRFGDEPLWLFATKNIMQKALFEDIIVTSHKDELDYMKKFSDELIFVHGGKNRQESLKNALLHVKTPYVLVSDIARACIDKEMLTRIIKEKGEADIIVPYIDVSDTVVYKDETIDRDDVKLIQTPQLSKTETLKKALAQNTIYTDDSSAVKSVGGSVKYVYGSKRAKKLTYFEDLEDLKCKESTSKDIFTGNGFDVHPFEKGKPMYLCGVKVHENIGFKAHSDGDVALHAIIDSLLGAIGAGDIGELFPDSDKNYENIDSKILLKNVFDFITKVGYKIINCDITIMAETPKLKEFKQQMSKTVSQILCLDPIKVNIKATTTEKLGFIGRKEGVAVNVTSTLKYIDWNDL